jgi:OOP family OmpA-OmpF porin
MFGKTTLMATVAAAILFGAAVANAGEPVKDHPLVSRFAGSEVLEHKAAEFDQFALPLGQIIDESQFTKSQNVEGKLTKFKYSLPKDRSSLEIFRTYLSALQKAGFQVLFQCAGNECRAPKSFQGGYRPTSSGIWCFNCEEPMRYAAARLSRPTGDVYVAVDVVKDNYEGGTWLTIIEPKPMQGGLVTVNAAALSSDIAQTGHASVYGIYFDTGKAELKPESNATLAEMSNLLTSNAQLKLHVVGHTDNAGGLASNMVLSKQRADAVVSALVHQYHISQTRLDAAGVGSLAPVASNKNEDGRAKNRRVELVEQ